MSNDTQPPPHVHTNDTVLATDSHHPLRICCYGSSSPYTPKSYLNQARVLGLTLAQHGHTCVNGAGAYGCMAALNDGAAEGDGTMIGVIHGMFIDGVTYNEGYHDAFNSEREEVKQGKRRLLIAQGDDLQQRKRMLVKKADALVVLPGGVGTWDELWEMTCSRSLGLTNIPIVCVNVNGYYDSFSQILQRAYDDKLIALMPKQLLHFEPSSVKAVEWIERTLAQPKVNNDIINSKCPLSFLCKLVCTVRFQDIKSILWGITPFAFTFLAGIIIGAKCKKKIQHSIQ